jgi:hypothetical protein
VTVLAGELCVGERLELGLEGVHGDDDLLELLERPALAGAQHLGENRHTE